jgi:hypothetical protein
MTGERFVDQKLNYPWQQAVVDAFQAPLDSLVVKINVADKTISARVRDPNPTDHEERIALNDALRALRVLMQETEAHTKALGNHGRETSASRET